ncbi:MAG: hypothetical protein GY761_13745, partial [Hyphomicrobiales bacterium]|nr:hypothetical protein [Hyphomicrobiales bacterium]
MMITDLFLQAVAQFVKVWVETITQEMAETLDFAAFEQGLDELMRQVCTVITAIKLTELLKSADFLAKLKHLGTMFY